MAKSAESAPVETARVSTQKPRLAWAASRGSPARTWRSRFWVVLPAITTGVPAVLATASASAVTGQASASMKSVVIRLPAPFYSRARKASKLRKPSELRLNTLYLQVDDVTNSASAAR